MLPPCCHRHAVCRRCALRCRHRRWRCRCRSAAAKLPPTLRCRAAATALMLPSCCLVNFHKEQGKVTQDFTHNFFCKKLTEILSVRKNQTLSDQKSSFFWDVQLSRNLQFVALVTSITLSTLGYSLILDYISLILVYIRRVTTTRRDGTKSTTTDKLHHHGGATLERRVFDIAGIRVSEISVYHKNPIDKFLLTKNGDWRKDFAGQHTKGSPMWEENTFMCARWFIRGECFCNWNRNNAASHGKADNVPSKNKPPSQFLFPK